jgi:hypothetical protein
MFADASTAPLFGVRRQGQQPDKTVPSFAAHFRRSGVACDRRSRYVLNERLGVVPAFPLVARRTCSSALVRDVWTFTVLWSLRGDGEEIRIDD